MVKLHPDVLKSRPPVVRYAVIFSTPRRISLATTAWTLKRSLNEISTAYLVDLNDLKTTKLLNPKHFFGEWAKHYLDSDWRYEVE